MVSLHTAANSLGLKLGETRALSRCFLNAYIKALADGKSRWIERSIAHGLIGDLLVQVEQRKRKDFLERHTLKEGKRRRCMIDGERLLMLEKSEREALFEWFENLAAKQHDPKFYRPLDVVRRVAGTGSLGLRRYAILVRGKGSPNGNYLLDMKLASESSAGKRLARVQPPWKSQAARVVAIQQRAQAIAPAFLTSVRYDGEDFVLKELQPSQDRLDLASVRGALKPLSTAIGSMGHLVAWSALRGSGRQRSACADELIAFAQSRSWTKVLIEYVEDYTTTVIAELARVPRCTARSGQARCVESESRQQTP